MTQTIDFTKIAYEPQFERNGSPDSGSPESNEAWDTLEKIPSKKIAKTITNAMLQDTKRV